MSKKLYVAMRDCMVGGKIVKAGAKVELNAPRDHFTPVKVVAKADAVPEGSIVVDEVALKRDLFALLAKRADELKTEEAVAEIEKLKSGELVEAINIVLGSEFKGSKEALAEFYFLLRALKENTPEDAPQENVEGPTEPGPGENGPKGEGEG